MEKEKLLQRITTNPKVMVGQPVIRGTRLTVHYILRLLASGLTPEQVTTEYEIAHEDIQACLLFASEALASSSFLPLTVEAH
jgi:uncharacterized protein (DUF433 family)